MNVLRISATAALLAVAAGMPLHAQNSVGCVRPREACAAFTKFLDALNRRDWPAFQATLDDSISVFVDAPDLATRQDGRAAAETVFRRLFPADLRVPSELPPPIRPEGLRTQDFGDVVIVSFHMRSADALARRTIVLQRRQQRWHVVHIHGSSQPVTSSR